jgi:hypothetical protein
LRRMRDNKRFLKLTDLENRSQTVRTKCIIRKSVIDIVKFEVITAVKMTMLFFWVMSPCRFVGRYIQGRDIMIQTDAY